MNGCWMPWVFRRFTVGMSAAGCPPGADGARFRSDFFDGPQVRPLFDFLDDDPAGFEAPAPIGGLL